MRCLQLIVAGAFTVCLAAPAAAQVGRVQGDVRDLDGNPVKGAIVKAIHPDARPSELTSATDERGRFALIGLRLGPNWRFVVEAPGYFPAENTVTIRAQAPARLTFRLRPDPGPFPGALARDIQAQLNAADALRNDGQYDEAIAAYEAIQSRNAKLTTLNLVLADVYRDKAELESGVARQTLLEKAMAAYQAVLKDDAGNARAKRELAAVADALKNQTR